MKKSVLFAVLALASVAASAQSYPGSNWSSLTYNPSPLRGTPEDGNVLLQGRLEQGMIVGKVGDGRVNLYGAVGYSADKNGLAYNNKIAPEIGVKFQQNVGTGLIEIGTAIVHQNSFRGVTTGPTSGTGVKVYAQYWFGWDLGK